jgi:RNA polymerase sigma factor (sigma-70 family)
MVYGVCLRILKDKNLAEDAAQASFLVLLRRATTLPKNVNLSGWLYMTAQNAARSTARGRQRQIRHERAVAEDSQRTLNACNARMGDTELLQHLDEALCALPNGQRTVVVLRYLQGFSAKEVAQQLKCAPATVDIQVSRAIARLREMFRQKGVATTTVSCIAILSSISIPAPSAVALNISAVCAGKSAASATALVTSNAVIKATIWLKIKVAAAAVACIIGVTGFAIVHLRKSDRVANVLPKIADKEKDARPAQPVAENAQRPELPPLPVGSQVIFQESFSTKPANWRGAVRPGPGSAVTDIAIQSVPLESALEFPAFVGEVRSQWEQPGWRLGKRTYLRFRYCTEKITTDESFKLMFKRGDQVNFACRLPGSLSSGWSTITMRLDERIVLDADHQKPLKQETLIHQLVWMVRSDTIPDRGAKFWIDDVTLFESPVDIPSAEVTKPD